MKVKTMTIPEVKAYLKAKEEKEFSEKKFKKLFAKAKTKLEGMKLQNPHKAAVIGAAMSFMALPTTAMAKMVVDGSSGSWAPVEKGGIFGGLAEGVDKVTAPLESIAKFTEGVMWVINNPLEALKVVLSGVCDFVEIAALVVCAAAIIMAIFGHKEYLKYVSLSFVIYFLLKVVVVIL